MILETKIYELFPGSQFVLYGSSVTYDLDRNAQGGEILLYFGNTITVKLLKLENLE